MNNRHQGFTLIEVIVVIILIGILAVNILPKFSGTDSFEAYTFRTSLISALRLTQQRAMQQTNSTFCHQIVLNDERYGIPNRTDCTVTDLSSLTEENRDKTGMIVDERYNVTFQINGVSNPSTISFDNMGRPLAGELGGCAGGCIINVTSAVETVQIKIESEGYIHGL